jgi:uncharacterized protein
VSDRLAAASVPVAYGALAAVFRGPADRFWPRMTRTGVGLGALALAARGAPGRLRGRDAGAGAAIAAGLYAGTVVGERLVRWAAPAAGRYVEDVYRWRTLRPAAELAARLAVVGPAEELYWRGLVQGALVDRLGPARGTAAATGLYAGAHLASGNPMLVGAAAAAGGAWGTLAALGVPMPALLVSHALWDVGVFLVRRPGPASGPTS